MKLELKVAQALTAQQKTLCLAESCTGGLVSNLLTNIPGSSKFLKCSVVAYSNEAKKKYLKVGPSLLNRYGAVSEPVAIAMAKGARKALNADFGLGITGIAGPDGGSSAKPVGLTWIAINTAKETLCLKCLFQGDRKSIKTQAANHALALLLEFLD